MRSEFYQTDLGNYHYFVSLSVPEDLTLLPSNYLPILSNAKFGGCSLPITPRHALITLVDGGDQFKIEYPFRPDTPDWYQFWQELYTNPLIASSIGVGEIIKSQSLRYALGV